MTVQEAAINPAIMHPQVLEFLKTRRSRPAKTLVAPVPDDAALQPMLEIAARSPDHGKLEPWRFIVLRRAALERLAKAATAAAQAEGLAPVDVEKAAKQFGDSHLCVAVISAPVDSAKIPQIEQTLSAGAVCYGLLCAALASGWGASWLSGWAAHNAAFGRDVLGLADGEWVAGFVHIGTEGVTPVDRPRPDLARITSYVTE
ncbi:nitroreductase [Thioclava sp. GXIMD4216]|uniref:nitroreductase family protein n=1 Tax=Thioclava sp. GXIMD4216 TaxID=3131929 RepID=UPI0030CEE18A